MKILFVFLLFALTKTQLNAQDEKKVSFTGAARSLFYADKLSQEAALEDTVTIPKLNSGHVLVDLGVNIRPNKNTEILGMVRIRNDYGGFWGSGVTFDVRQLYLKGVVGGIVRYQIGDIDYKMTPFTFWNYDQELISNAPVVFQQQTDVINYDHFNNNDNSRRQQGAAAECALVFRKWVKELQFHAVTTRVKTSDFSSTNDRLFSGLNMQLVQSKYFEAGANIVSLYDVSGTSRNEATFHNPVYTGRLLGNYGLNKLQFNAEMEFGESKTRYRNDSLAPVWNDQFFTSTFKVEQSEWGLQLSAKSILVGASFRSPGAQTKRLDYGGLPNAYTRITNEQQLRPYNMLDLMRESAFYNLQLQPYLMEFNPNYDNITPYGDATPNRQGYKISLRYAKKKSPINLEISHYQLQEIRGEGMLLPRNFTRNTIQLDVRPNEFFGQWKKQCHVSISYRDDLTTRQAQEQILRVDLNTRDIKIGLEIETFESFDVLLGFQQLSYQGFDYLSVRNNYSEIYNFTEYKVKGTEHMQAVGVRYRFSEKAFLSAQLNKFQVSNDFSAVANYSIDQIMLLFQMKF